MNNPAINTTIQQNLNALTAPNLISIKGGQPAAPKNANQLVAENEKIQREKLDLSLIRTDGDIRMRIDVNPAVTARYAELMKDGVTFFPVTVFYDGTSYWLADGFYRLDAANQVGKTSIWAEVKQGSQREARLFAMNANNAHGAIASTRDKRYAASILLRDEEWKTWANREISRHLGISDKTVGTYRKQVEEEDKKNGCAESPQKRKFKRNGNTYVMNTSRQTKNPIKPEPVLESHIFHAIKDLPIAGNLNELNLLLKLPVEDQKQVVNIIAAAQLEGKNQPVADAATALRKIKIAEERARRVEDALKAGYDDNFVLGSCVQVLKKTTQLQPGSVRLLLADGPYGVNYISRDETIETIDDDKTLEAALKLHENMLKAIEPYMMPDCHVMLFCDKRYEPEFRQLALNAGYQFKDSLIWHKGDGGRPIPNQSLRNHERVIWFTKGKPRILTNMTDVLDHPRYRSGEETRDTSHPTPKPLNLLSELIEVATVEGELLVDPFAGSASTLIAAKQLGRRYFGVEKKKLWFREGTVLLKKAERIQPVDTQSPAPAVDAAFASDTHQELLSDVA